METNEILESNVDAYSVEIAKRILDPERIKGIPTGFKNLDSLIGGLKKGSLVVFVGTTGMGKSLFSIQLMVNLVKSGNSVTYFDLENGKAVSWERLTRAWFKLEASYYVEKNSKDLARKMEQIEKAGLSYYDKAEIQAWMQDEEMDIKSLISSIIRADKSANKIFFIDPLQVLESGADSRDLFQVQGRNVEELKDLAQETGAIIFLCHHMNKGGEDVDKAVKSLDKVGEASFRIPSLPAIMGSSKIANFATDVWGMLRIASAKTQEERSKTLIRVLKSRTGRTGDVIQYFHEDFLGFDDQPLLRQGPNSFEMA